MTKTKTKRLTLKEAIELEKHIPTAPFTDKTFYTKKHTETQALLKRIFTEHQKVVDELEETIERLGKAE